jgi:hypothetical protein
LRDLDEIRLALVEVLYWQHHLPLVCYSASEEYLGSYSIHQTLVVENLEDCSRLKVVAVAGLAGWASLPLLLLPHVCHMLVSLPRTVGVGEDEDRQAMDLSPMVVKAHWDGTT